MKEYNQKQIICHTISTTLHLNKYNTLFIPNTLKKNWMIKNNISILDNVFVIQI